MMLVNSLGNSLALGHQAHDDHDTAAFGTGKDLFWTTLKDDVLHDISHLLAVGFAFRIENHELESALG